MTQPWALYIDECIFIATGHIVGSEAAILAIFTDGERV